MTEELLSNEAGRKKFDSGIRTTDLPILNHTHKPLGYQTLIFATDFIATSFTSE